MRTIAWGALATVACWAATAAAQDRPPGDQPLHPDVARCVLENLDRARGWTDGYLVRQACEGLVGPAAEAARARDPGHSYLVECRVPDDPEWIEFRLVTRQQCDQANGSYARR
jgi:hypothetical protein